MAIQFNHTILYARDSQASAKFLADILGLPTPTHWGPFEMVATANGANLDYMDTDGSITPQHYAFLISEEEFDDIFDRIQARRLPYWADPGQQQEGKINRHDGGRGVYFEDPNGHLLRDHHPSLRQRRLESVSAATESGIPKILIAASAGQNAEPSDDPRAALVPAHPARSFRRACAKLLYA